jgi:tetratricopeptide (TPR) repeat protein
LFALCPLANAQDPATEGTISGTVFLPGNNGPASQVAVSLKSHEAGIFRSVLTDYEGHFEIRGLPPSTYEITIEEQGYQPLHSTAQLDGALLHLELHLAPPSSPQAPANSYTVSVRELGIPGKARDEYRKGLVSLAKKELVNSLSHFARAVQAFPGYFEALYHLGVVQVSLGQSESAMQAFQKSFDLSGGRYARAEFGIGYLYYLQGKEGEAETITRKGLELDPNSADGYVILGMTLLRLNRTDEAEKSAREALQRNPNQADAYLVLADASARRQNYQQQVEELDTYLRLSPNGPASLRVHQVREVALRFLGKDHPQK